MAENIKKMPQGSKEKAITPSWEDVRILHARAGIFAGPGGYLGF